VARQGFILVGPAGGEWEQQAGGRGFTDKKSNTNYSAGPTGTMVVKVDKTSAAGTFPLGPPPVSDPIALIKTNAHTPAPRAQASPAPLNGQAALVIENGTVYAMSVFIAGPVSENFTIMPGKAHVITLAPGAYDVAASVTTPNILPFYGQETLAPNTRYSQKY